MAKGRKRTTIRKIKNSERDALKCLWRTGVATKSQLEEHFDLKGSRLQNFQNSGYIKINGDTVTLHSEGVRYCEKELGMNYRYRSDPTHLAHDLKLTYGYLRLPLEVRETWKTESQIFTEVKNLPSFHRFKEEIIKADPRGVYKATPDAAFQNPITGKFEGFEVKTKNYKDIDIQQKVEFSNTFLNGIHIF